MNPYDEIAYPSQVFVQTQPDRLATIATLRGLTPAHPLRCRMLDLGCGDGMNILACAQAAPESEFLGVELAAAPVARGNALAAEAGLGNVRIVQGDVAAPDPAWGTFDYVAAHGVYSWVPPEVREALLATVSRCLAPGGVGYVSYGTKPGATARSTIRQMLLRELAGTEHNEDRVTRAIEFLRVFRAARTRKNDPFDTWLRHETDDRLGESPEYLRHDDLGDINEPVWFSEFAAHAARCGLVCLGEADWPEDQDTSFPSEVRDAIEARAGAIEREQFRDLLKCRRFRQTLVVRRGTEASARKRTDRIPKLFVAGEVRTAGADGSPTPWVPLDRRAPESFAGPGSGRVTTDSPVGRAALRLVGAAWPRRLPFEELLAAAVRDVRQACAAADEGAAPSDDDRTELVEIVSTLHDGGVLDLHTHTPVFAFEAGERPVATPLARACARVTTQVVSVLQHVFDLADFRSRRLLTLLDGTLDRPALLRCLAAAEAEGDGVPEDAPPLSAELVDRTLAGLARRALLVR